MVKLSRISLVFLALGGLPALLPLATNGPGSCAAFFTGGDFLETGGRVAVFFAAAVVLLAVAGALLLVAGAAAVVFLARAAGLATAGLALAVAVGLAAGVADFVSAGFLVLSATINFLKYTYGINSIFS
jgi:hypothetical protein